jgi:peptidoglycan L-alanyl-D-glutamate endopeptidase CwlK
MATNTEKRVRFLELFGLLCTKAKVEGIQFIVWTFDRTPQEQNYLYQQGRTRPGKVITNCDGYIKKSAHENWLAIDLAIVKNGKVVWDPIPEYFDLGEYWESLGGTWGGRFSAASGVSGDIYHFEYKGD